MCWPFINKAYKKLQVLKKFNRVIKKNKSKQQKLQIWELWLVKNKLTSIKLSLIWLALIIFDTLLKKYIKIIKCRHFDTDFST